METGLRGLTDKASGVSEVRFWHKYCFLGHKKVKYFGIIWFTFKNN